MYVAGRASTCFGFINRRNLSSAVFINRVPCLSICICSVVGGYSAGCQQLALSASRRPNNCSIGYVVLCYDIVHTMHTIFALIFCRRHFRCLCSRQRSIVWCKAHFDTIESFELDSRVWQTDEQTDGQTANAALNYVARPKIAKLFLCTLSLSCTRNRVYTSDACP